MSAWTPRYLVDHLIPVEKSENLDNAFYVFLRFVSHDTSKDVKSRVFLDFEKNVKNVFSNYARNG